MHNQNKRDLTLKGVNHSCLANDGIELKSTRDGGLGDWYSATSELVLKCARRRGRNTLSELGRLDSRSV